MTSVLVTGGCGFIGSHVVDTLVDSGLDVRVVDRVPPPAERENGGADYVVGDVSDLALMERCVDGVEAVSHQAAMVGLGVDFGDVTRYAHDNDLGTATLLRALHGRGFRGRLVLASSMVVYGEGRYRCVEHGLVRPGPRAPADLDAGRFDPPCPTCERALDPQPVDEDAPADPRNVYAATKLHQEHLFAAYGREHGVPVCYLRYHNVYGPRMPRDTPYAGVASIFCSALAAGRAPDVFEDGRQRRDFVHVGDVARANLVALTVPRVPTGAFNVASGEPRTVGDVADALRCAFGPAAARPKVTRRWRSGDVRHVVASPERAAAVLGFRAEIPFKAGMAALAAAATPGDRARESGDPARSGLERLEG